MNSAKEIQRLQAIMNDHLLFDKYALSKVGVFGSVARGEEGNDIDLLIEDKIDYKKLIEMKTELEAKLGKRVDLMIAEYANPIVLHRAMQEIVYVTKH